MASDADHIANQMLRELDKIPTCDSPSCLERAKDPKAKCPHGQRLPREAASKPEKRESRDWSTASDADVRKEMRRLSVPGSY